ncbi:MAG: putative cardiolipin synthase [Limisphaerales bacterium]
MIDAIRPFVENTTSVTRSTRSCFRLIRCILLAFVCQVAAADQARLLHTPHEAAEERVRMIVDAKKEIHAAYFIVGHDPVTLTGLTLLRDAARRGLTVRLLVDAQWNKIPASVEAHLIEEGVQIRVYHPLDPLRPDRITRRLHDKLLLADGEVMIGGGRNIESPYFGLGRQIFRRNYIDLDILTRGDSAAHANEYFMTMWNSGHVRSSKVYVSRPRRRWASKKLDKYELWLKERIAAYRENGPSDPPLSIEVGPIEFLHDPVESEEHSLKVKDGLLALMDSATSELLIESPYLIPTRAFWAAIDRARARGVRVRILTNSLKSTDAILAQSGYIGERKKLVERGVELWEYAGVDCLHTKAAVIDGETAVIGTFNLDPRSANLNTELAWVVRNQTLADGLRRVMDRHLKESMRIDERGRPAGHKRRFPGVSCWKVFKLRSFRLIAPFIRHQL